MNRSIALEEKIMLWECEAPYTQESPEQEQPSVKAFPVEGARGAVVVLPGENEMEALAFGGLRLLDGKEQPNIYTLPEGYKV